jgi:hypothetical protein
VKASKRKPHAVNKVKSPVNILNGVVAGFSAFIGMILTRMFLGEESLLIRVSLGVVIAVVTALCLNFAIRIFRKSRTER